MDQLEQMTTFVRIVEAGSITRAAEQLDTVKSAVSKKLRDLEKRLGVTLIVRTTRAHALTNAGEQYYQHCVRILDDIHEAEAQLDQHQQSLSGRIRLTIPTTYGLSKISPLIHDFQQQHPDIFFDIDFNDGQQDLIAEGFDLAIRIASLQDSSLIARKLSSTQLWICGSEDYFALHGQPNTPEDLLNGHVRLTYSNANHPWSFVDRHNQPLSINLPSVVLANNGQFLLQSAIAGKGLVCMPDFICEQAVNDGQLIRILEANLQQNELGVYAVYPPTRYLSYRIRYFVTYLQAQLSKEGQ